MDVFCYYFFLCAFIFLLYMSFHYIITAYTSFKSGEWWEEVEGDWENEI